MTGAQAGSCRFSPSSSRRRQSVTMANVSNLDKSPKALVAVQSRTLSPQQVLAVEGQLKSSVTFSTVPASRLIA